ncbi:MAG: hypothetical protein AAFV53_38050 [Myxococcota bacterium]
MAKTHRKHAQNADVDRSTPSTAAGGGQDTSNSARLSLLAMPGVDADAADAGEMGWMGQGLANTIAPASSTGGTAPLASLQQDEAQKRQRVMMLLAGQLPSHNWQPAHLDWLAGCSPDTFSRWLTETYYTKNAGDSMTPAQRMSLAEKMIPWFTTTLKPAVLAWKAASDKVDQHPQAQQKPQQAPSPRARRAPRTKPKTPPTNTAQAPQQKKKTTPAMSPQEKARLIKLYQQKCAERDQIQAKMRKDASYLRSVRSFMRKPEPLPLWLRILIHIGKGLAREPSAIPDGYRQQKEDELKEENMRRRKALEAQLLSSLTAQQVRLKAVLAEIAQLQKRIPPPFGYATGGR